MSAAHAELYERFVRPLLFLLDPETAHHLALGALRFASAAQPILRLLDNSQPSLTRSQVFGLNFPNPIGLAAGFDKNGVAIPAWAALGFGFVEIGTVTARAQPGNPKPRIFRHPAQQALVNRLGFNNDGADAVADRLRRLRDGDRWPAIPIGVNIGKSKVTPIEQAHDDYLYSFRLLGELADYIALNVSSPNTPGLRSLQDRDSLARLLETIAEANAALATPKPLLLKIAPDLTEPEIEAIIAECEAHAVAGLIATNTTLDHSAIGSAVGQTGGLSGLPLQRKSTDVIRFIRSRTRLPIIGVGGIFDAASAREKFGAGAELVQIYTGLIYRGPALIHEIADCTRRNPA